MTTKNVQKTFIIITMPINISSLIVLSLLLTLISSQSTPSNMYVSLFTPLGNYSVIRSNVTDENFIRNINKFSCSLNNLFTYDQTDYLYSINAFYYLTISGIGSPTSVSITTVHNNFQPSYSPLICQPPFCTISIQNNCPQSINFFNYFDRILIKI